MDSPVILLYLITAKFIKSWQTHFVTSSNLSTWMRTHWDHSSGWKILLYTLMVCYIRSILRRNQS